MDNKYLIFCLNELYFTYTMLGTSINSLKFYEDLAEAAPLASKRSKTEENLQ